MSDYRTPFISQYPDNDGDIDDCQVASVMMLVAAWTNGAAITDADGDPLDTAGLARLRRRLRNSLGPARQAGGLSLDDMAEAVERQWPALPPLPRWTAGQDISFDELWARLAAGDAAVVNGNPSRVTNANSPLRRFTNNDDFGHAVFVERLSRDNTRALIMDPLGRETYDGNWVPRNELRQFLTAFGTRDDRAVAVVKRGGAERFLRPKAPKPPADPCADLRAQLATTTAAAERWAARVNELETVIARALALLTEERP